MVSQKRTERIAERIFEELSSMLLLELSDPRVENATVTHVKVDKELSYTDIYISSFLGRSESEVIIEGLNHAKGYIRKELSRRIELRSFPQLRFRWDPIPEQADKIDRLIASLHTDDNDENNTDEE